MGVFMKFIQLILLFCATVMSLFMLISKVNVEIIFLLPIILLAVIDLIIEWIIEKEFSNSMNFFNKLSQQAHPFARQLWEISKKIMFMLILNLLGFSLLSLYTDIYELTNKMIFYKGAIFVGGLSVILLGISISIRMILGSKYNTIRNKKFGFIIDIPNHWNFNKELTNSNGLIVYENQISDMCCFIFIEEKNNFHDSTNLLEFYEFQEESLLLDKSITMEDKEMVKTDSCCIRVNCFLFIKKRKYNCYRYFIESKRFYYEVRLVASAKYASNEEINSIINSFMLIS